MSRKFLTPIDLSKNELQNARIQNLASAPSSPVIGQIYYDTALQGLYIWNGTAWALAGGISAGALSARPLATAVAAGTFFYATDNFLVYYSNGSTWQQVNNFGSSTVTETSYGQSSSNGSSTNYARADHTHGTPALGSSTPNAISGTTGSVGTASVPSREDHTHAFTPASDLSMAGYKLTNLATPVSSTDAATKGYVDSTAQGLNVKASVAVTTVGSNITLSGTQTIDGVALTAGQRVLVKDQSTSSQNGIYIVAAGAWSRSTDEGAPAIGDFVFVELGTAWGHTGWIITSVTGGITWTQFSAAGEYISGNGITISGNSIAFNPTSTGGLQAASGGASILLQTNSGLGTTSAGLAVGAGSGIVVSTGTVAIDTTVVVRKYAANVGDGSSTSITVTHNLGTRDVQVTLYDASTYAEVMTDVTHATTNTITLAFTSAPTSNQYRVVVFG